MSRSRLIGIIFLAGGLLLSGVFSWHSTREIKVQTLPVQRNVEVRVFGIGTVEAQVLSKIGFQIAGKVVSVTADQGDQVKAGATCKIGRHHSVIKAFEKRGYDAPGRSQSGPSASPG